MSKASVIGRAGSILFKLVQKSFDLVIINKAHFNNHTHISRHPIFYDLRKGLKFPKIDIDACMHQSVVQGMWDEGCMAPRSWVPTDGVLLHGHYKLRKKHSRVCRLIVHAQHTVKHTVKYIHLDHRGTACVLSH